MTAPRHRFATVAVAVAVALALAAAGGVLAQGTSAAPSTGTTVTYEMIDCVGPAGTPASLVGVKQPSGAAALHLTSGGNFVFKEAVVAATGEVLFSTPGFERNDNALVTCTLVAPEPGIVVSGLVTPARRSAPVSP